VTDQVSNPRFVADHMLGSLARWLRMIGYDTVYDKGLDDKGLSELARAENRFLLTRDKELAKEPGAFLLEQDDLDSQLKATGAKFGLKYNENLIRCSACNGDLLQLPKEEAKAVVPEGAYAGNDKFWKCSKCGKVFWKGSHWLGIMDRLKKLSLT
jgi:uncharacterized protein with PIN domain